MQVLAFSLVQSCGFWPKYKLRPIWSKFVARSEVLFLSLANKGHSAPNIEHWNVYQVFIATTEPFGSCIQWGLSYIMSCSWSPFCWSQVQVVCPLLVTRVTDLVAQVYIIGTHSEPTPAMISLTRNLFSLRSASIGLSSFRRFPDGIQYDFQLGLLGWFAHWDLVGAFYILTSRPWCARASIVVDMKPGGTMGGDDWWIDMYCDILFYFNCIGG